DHSCGMELHKFHIYQLRARFISQSHSIAGVLPRIGCDASGLSNSARRNYDRFGFKHYEAFGFLPIRKCACHALVISQQPRDRALHVAIESLLHTTVLERSNHLQARPVAYVAEPLEGVSSERALKDCAAVRAIE